MKGGEALPARRHPSMSNPTIASAPSAVAFRLREKLKAKRPARKPSGESEDFEGRIMRTLCPRLVKPRANCSVATYVPLPERVVAGVAVTNESRIGPKLRNGMTLRQLD